MSNVLVTGGAGYIGSHTVRALVEKGHRVTVIDNLYSGHRWAVHPEARFVQCDIADSARVEEVLSEDQIDSVVHFAGHIVVPESVTDPIKYYQNNVVGSLSLLRSCANQNIHQFVFSSSAAVYGNPAEVPVREETMQCPINPYGTTKLVTEWTLRDFAAAVSEFRYIALRYFNVAGAHSSGELGQATPAATHLIKVACQAALGQRPGLSVFGTDYPTPDGTCIRDYIHVQDLAQAHLDALDYLGRGGESAALNCGYGRGFSVNEVVAHVKQASAVDFPVSLSPRRAGDPAELVADNTQIRSLLAWKPEFDNLELICRSAYEWEKNPLNLQSAEQ